MATHPTSGQSPRWAIITKVMMIARSNIAGIVNTYINQRARVELKLALLGELKNLPQE